MLYPAISAILFYVFALAAVLSAIGVVALRNPVSSALSMALCFGFTAAIFFNMGATFLGISQIIVYAGAILVLFLFITMMLDVKKEETASQSCCGIFYAVMGVVVAGVFAGMMVNASIKLPGATEGRCPMRAFMEGSSALCVGDSATPAAPQEATVGQYGGPLPALRDTAAADTTLLGNTLFSHYSITFVILSFALLAGTVGAVAVGRKLRKD